MTWRRGLITVVCVFALALGTLVAVEPNLLFDTVPELRTVVLAVDPSLVLLALLLGLTLITLLRGASGRSAAGAPPSFGADRSSALGWETRTMIGSQLDTQLAAATAYDEADEGEREHARSAVESELRSLATANYAHVTGCDPDTAEDVVLAGEWTADPRAAAFLADEDGPSTPVRLWLVDVLTGRDSFERGVERTIRSVRRVQRNDTEVSG